jgi:protein-L-isoaspartate(D-aspartate) O-methyltransferase
MDIEKARLNMVEKQIRPWDVLDRRVLDVFLHVPREQFVPQPFQAMAFADTDIPLPHGQYMLRPTLEGRILKYLSPGSSDRVLVVGTGSGYLTACLARLAGQVESIDIFQDFSKSAALRLARLGIDNVSLAVGNAAQHWGQVSQYNAIVISGSVSSIPDSYRRALAINGRLFVLVGQPCAPIMTATLITRIAAEQWMQDNLFETWLPPLINGDSVPGFQDENLRRFSSKYGQSVRPGLTGSL